MPEADHVDPNTDVDPPEESIEEQLRKVTRERDDERLLTKDLNQEILNLKLTISKIQHEKEEVEIGMKEICEAKLAMSQVVAEAKAESESLRKKIVSIQMTNLEQQDNIELLEQQLAQANRSERERYEEVKLQAQRLQQAEQDLEDMQRSMSQIRAPPPSVASPGPQVSESPGQNKSFGIKDAGGWLKNLVHSKMGSNHQPPQYPKHVQEVLQKCKHNGRCADCDLAHPTWLSTGFGIFICTECAGIHRSFGSHVTTVRSLTLDTISQVQIHHACGNKCSNDIYLATSTTPADISDTGKRVEFLRKKYIHKSFKNDEVLHCADCRKVVPQDTEMNLVCDHGTLVCSECGLIHEKTNQTGELKVITDHNELQLQIVMSEAANKRLTHNKLDDTDVSEAFIRDKYINRKFSIVCADCNGIDAQFYIPRYCVLICAGCSHIHRSFDPEVEVIDVTKSKTPIAIYNDEANARLLPKPPTTVPPKTDPSFRQYIINKYSESRPLPTRIKCADCLTESAVPNGVKVVGYNCTHGTFLCTRCSSLQQEILGVDSVEDVDLSLYDAEKNAQSNIQLLAGLPKGYPIPDGSDEDELRSFITKKYKHRFVENPDEIPGSSWLNSTLNRLQNVAHNIFSSDSDAGGDLEDEPVLVDDVPTVGSGELVVFTPKVFGYVKKRKPVEGEEEPGSPQIPVLQNLPDSAVILSAAWRQLLCEKLPTEYERMDWIRSYCSSVDGGSLSSLYTACKDKGAGILIVRTTDGEIFGGYSNESWSHQPRYHGNGEVFVFKFKGASCEKWGWSSQNEYFMLSHKQTLAFGGGGGPAICIDATLSKGSSGHCETFESPPLTSRPDFTIQSLELWNFSDELGAE